MDNNASTISVKIYLPAIIMGLGAFIATFDVTAVSLALPEISSDFSLVLSDSVWVMNAYSLSFTIMLIVAGALSDRFGNKLSLVFGASLFLFASLLCAFAPDYTVLVAGRVAQGVAAAFIVCGGYALMGALFVEKEQRVKAFAIMGTIGGSALAIGPGLGGIITNQWGWEWVFLLKVPVCLFIVVGSTIGFQEKKKNSTGRFDIGGVIIFSLLLFLVSWSLINGPKFLNYNLGTLGVTLLSFALLATFVVYEANVSNPAVEIRLFITNARFVGFSAVPLCLAISYWSLIIYIPIYLQKVFQIDVQIISHIMLFFTFPMFLVPYATRGLAANLRDFIFYPGGLFIVGLGCFIMAISALQASYVIAVMGMVLASSGAAALQTQVSGALIASAPQDKAGSVSAIMTILRQGGFAVGVALLSVTVTSDASSSNNDQMAFVIMFGLCGIIAAIGCVLTYFLIFAGEQTEENESAL